MFCFFNDTLGNEQFLLSGTATAGRFPGGTSSEQIITFPFNDKAWEESTQMWLYQQRLKIWALLFLEEEKVISGQFFWWHSILVCVIQGEKRHFIAVFILFGFPFFFFYVERDKCKCNRVLKSMQERRAALSVFTSCWSLVKGRYCMCIERGQK